MSERSTRHQATPANIKSIAATIALLSAAYRQEEVPDAGLDKTARYGAGKRIQSTQSQYKYYGRPGKDPVTSKDTR